MPKLSGFGRKRKHNQIDGDDNDQLIVAPFDIGDLRDPLLRSAITQPSVVETTEYASPTQQVDLLLEVEGFSPFSVTQENDDYTPPISQPQETDSEDPSAFNFILDENDSTLDIRQMQTLVSDIYQKKMAQLHERRKELIQYYSNDYEKIVSDQQQERWESIRENNKSLDIQFTDFKSYLDKRLTAKYCPLKKEQYDAQIIAKQKKLETSKAKFRDDIFSDFSTQRSELYKTVQEKINFIETQTTAAIQNEEAILKKISQKIRTYEKLSIEISQPRNLESSSVSIVSSTLFSRNATNQNDMNELLCKRTFDPTPIKLRFESEIRKIDSHHDDLIQKIKEIQEMEQNAVGDLSNVLASSTLELINQINLRRDIAKEAIQKHISTEIATEQFKFNRLANKAVKLNKRIQDFAEDDPTLQDVAAESSLISNRGGVS